MEMEKREEIGERDRERERGRKNKFNIKEKLMKNVSYYRYYVST